MGRPVDEPGPNDLRDPFRARADRHAVASANDLKDPFGRRPAVQPPRPPPGRLRPLSAR